MTEFRTPVPEPGAATAAKLGRSTAIALGIAVVILFTAVLPAEYGVDPTGVGRIIGLTQMGEIKQSLAREAAAEAAEESAAAPVDVATKVAPEAVATPEDSLPPDQHTARVELLPNEGKELKLSMRKGARVAYAWSSDGGVVNHDTHADSTGAPQSYHRYSRATGVSADSGTLVAAFDGKHGWFWRNRGSGAVTITLQVRGDFDEIHPPE